MSDGEPWYQPFFAPAIVVAIVFGVIGWARSYLAGKKSNIKEARILEEDRIDRADKKGVKERLDAKVLETEKTEAATSLKDSAAIKAVEVKRESRNYINNKFAFSDQEHAHQHSELKNAIKELNTKIEQVRTDLRNYIKSKEGPRD